MLIIDSDKCNACGLCETSCPFGAITVEDEVAKTNDLCTLCAACVNVCPQGALGIERRQASVEDLSHYKGVFIWAECEPRGAKWVPKKVAYEILSKGRSLADQLGEQLHAVVLGDDRLTDLDSLCYHGADRVLCCRHAFLDRYTSDGFTTVISAVIAKEKPSIFLYGATPNGRDLAPRVIGMSSSKKIIAIKKDPDAPIFKIVDLGIVGDALVILPKLMNEIERIKVRP